MLKKIVHVSCVLLIVTLTMGIWAQNIEKVPEEKVNAVIGGWVQRGFYYVFDDRGIMKAVKISGEPVGYRQYEYSTFRMSGNDFIEYSNKRNKRLPLNLLLMDEITDSTAVFASGTPFVRADSSEGLLGTWKSVEGPTAMIWTIEPDIVQYTETFLEIESGSVKIIENRRGTYHREPAGRDVYRQTEKGGRYQITFEDGRTRTLLPVINDGMMYLFDLSPTKSEFIGVDPDGVPTYRDYQAVLKKREAVSKK